MTQLQQVLLSNATTTGSSIDWPGGYCAVSCEGTFNGATATLTALSGNGTYLPVGVNVTFSASGWGGAFLPPCKIRMEISGAVPAAMYAYANTMPTQTSKYFEGI